MDLKSAYVCKSLVWHYCSIPVELSHGKYIKYPFLHFMFQGNIQSSDNINGTHRGVGVFFLTAFITFPVETCDPSSALSASTSGGT